MRSCGLEVCDHLVLCLQNSAVAFGYASDLVLIEEFPTAVVRAIGSGEREATLIRYRDTLVVVSVAGDRRGYRTYRLGALVNPVGIADGGDMERNARLDLPPWNRPSPTAIAAFYAVGAPGRRYLRLNRAVPVNAHHPVRHRPSSSPIVRAYLHLVQKAPGVVAVALGEGHRSRLLSGKGARTGSCRHR